MTDGKALREKVVVVTGGTRGIGRATAELLAEAGATVVVTGRDENGAAKAAAEIAEAHGVPAMGLGFDVADFAAVGEAFKAIAKEQGRIDGLVANAGVLEDALVGMITPELVERMLSINVSG